MSPVRDESLMLRRTSDGALTASAALTAIELNGTLAEGLALQINCPTAFTGTSPTLTVSIHGDTDSTTGATSDDTLVATVGAITAAGEYIIPFSTPLRSVLVKLDVAGTSPSLGAVEVAIVKNVGKPWSRTIEFH